MPPATERSSEPVTAFALPVAEPALFASHCSSPSEPVHGAIRIATEHATSVIEPFSLISIALTVAPTMNARAPLADSSFWVGRPPGHSTAYPLFLTVPFTTLVNELVDAAAR